MSLLIKIITSKLRNLQNLKKGACGSVLKDAKLKGSKIYELLYDFHMFLDQNNEFLYDFNMTFYQNSEFFDKENNLEIKELQKSQKKAPAAAFCRTRSSKEVNMNIFVML